MTYYSHIRLNIQNIARLKARQKRQRITLHVLGILVMIFGALFLLTILFPKAFDFQSIDNLCKSISVDGTKTQLCTSRRFLLPLYIMGLVASVCLIKYPDTFPQLYQDQMIHKSLNRPSNIMRNHISHYLFRWHNYVLGMLVLSTVGFYIALLEGNPLSFCHTQHALILCGYICGAVYFCSYLYFCSLYPVFKRNPPFPIHIFCGIPWMLQKAHKKQKSIFVHNSFADMDADKLYYLWVDYAVKQVSYHTTYASEILWQWIAAQWQTFTYYLYPRHSYEELMSMYVEFWKKLIKSCPLEAVICFTRLTTIQLDQTTLWEMQEFDSKTSRNKLQSHIALLQCSLLKTISTKKKLRLSCIIALNKIPFYQNQEELKRILRNIQRLLLCGCVYETHTIITRSKKKLSNRNFDEMITETKRVRMMLRNLNEAPNVQRDLYSDAFVKICYTILGNADLEPYNTHAFYLNIDDLNVEFVERVLGIPIE